MRCTLDYLVNLLVDSKVGGEATKKVPCMSVEDAAHPTWHTIYLLLIHFHKDEQKVVLHPLLTHPPSQAPLARTISLSLA